MEAGRVVALWRSQLGQGDGNRFGIGEVVGEETLVARERRRRRPCLPKEQAGGGGGGKRVSGRGEAAAYLVTSGEKRQDRTGRRS